MLVAAWSALALGAYGESDLATADRAVSEAAALFDRTADADIAAHDPGVAVWLGWAETCLERLDDSIRHLERAVAIARSTQQRHLIAGLLAFETQALRLKGRLGDIHRNADAVTELALLMDSDVPRRMAMTMRAAAEVISGDMYAAVRFADRDDPPSGIARIVLAEAMLEIGEPERCDALLLDKDGAPRLPRIPFCEAYGLFQLTRSALARGALEQAEAYAARAGEIASRCPTLLPRSSAAQARGALLLARGDPGEACREATVAIDCAERLGAPLVAARARILLGDALAALGDRAAATAELRTAHAELESLGAGRHADQAARSLRKLGRGVPRRAATRANGEVSVLSARELEVLSLVVQGKTNRQIAEDLYLSVRTVDRHLSRIFDKLGVSSRAAAASVLARSHPVER
jgi:ATP/maltotriose-dependent transcriptional regulator MalT